MDLDSLKPIFLGVCAKYAKEWNLNVRTFRVLTLVSMFVFQPTLIIYIILGLIELPLNNNK